MKLDYTKIKQIPFKDVLDHYRVELVEKQVSGDVKLVGRCPIHTDGEQQRNKNHFQATIASRNPAVVGSFHCFSCGARGTVVDFVVLMERLVEASDVDWAQVAEDRRQGAKANWCPVEKLKLASQLLHTWFLEGRQRPQKPSGATNGPQATPSTPLTENRPWREIWGKLPSYPKFLRPHPYLAGRGIAPEVLSEFGVGYYENDRSKSVCNGHIMFPIQNQAGELVAYAWRRVESGSVSAKSDTSGQKMSQDDTPRYCFPPAEKFNKALELWNLHRAIKESRHVYVVEGFFGCMNLWQHGYRASVALMGSNLSERQAELLRSEFDSCCFILDPDDAGAKLKAQVLRVLVPRIPVRVIEPEQQIDLMSKTEIAALF